MEKFDIFIEQSNKQYKFNGYAYEEKDGKINLEINTIPFNKKLIMLKSKTLFKIAS